MRDRLIELIDEYTELLSARDIHQADFAEEFADHLLAAGVIVPPCKVGDKVYYPKAELGEICPAKVIGIYNNLYTPSMPLWITIEYDSKLIGRHEERMASEVFAMLCKPTAEEAEKALAERREG